MDSRKFIGMLTPSSNTVLEPITNKILNSIEGVTSHFSRFTVTEISSNPNSLNQFNYSKIIESAKLLAEFISDQFRLNQLRTDQRTVSRKDNYFLGFLKQTIMLFVKYDPACLAGVKIAIKGRFNRAPRARTAKIHFGKFSLQSFSSKVDYYQSTAYTSNGTFGVKVWLCENNYYKMHVITTKKN